MSFADTLAGLGSPYSPEIRSFACNTKGRDIIVGDIHGFFTKLYESLVAIGFDGEHDRLFSVGDLVDRGPESPEAFTWLRQPWFHAIRGNHEEMAVEYAAGNFDTGRYRADGGAWNIGNTPDARNAIAATFLLLPTGFQISTPGGLVGVLHADCPADSWFELKRRLGANGVQASATRDMCVWSRDRAKSLRDTDVQGVRAVVVGHQPVPRVTSLGNVLYIDTHSHEDRREFTLLDAATLRPAEPRGAAASLVWSGT